MAAFADEYNVPFRTLSETGAAYDRVREASAETGRTVLLSAAQTVCVGRDQAEIERRAAAIGQDVAGLRAGGLAGTPAEVVDKIGQLGELGAERVYLQVMDLSDLEHLELIAAEVLPHV